ncbi:murein hydrolase activator EnvC family protein, partial [Halorhodospira neutriphila]
PAGAARRPAAAQRLLVYYDYLHEARGERIAAAAAELRRLAELRRRLRGELERLERLEAELAERREGLAERRAERRSRRQALERRIAERGEAAERLEEQVAEQEALLERLRGRLADIPEGIGAGRGLGEARGELPWPVQGPLEARFGDPRGGGLKRKGIIVAAEPGTDVQAVAAGRVVFSDWLRGLGLLVIIDHGDGYLTLYGHNQALYVEVGEWLEAGDLLGSVGSSGARGEPGLYFGVRHGGEPENPLAWLR